MKDVVIINGVRSPTGKFGDGLSSVRPNDLLADIYKDLLTMQALLSQGRGRYIRCRGREFFGAFGGDRNRDLGAF